MTELDTEIGPLALELIDEYGKAISYSRVTPGEYNTDTGAVESATVVIELRAIVEEYAGQSFLSGLIEAGDKKVTIAANSVDTLPTTQDTVLIDNITYTVVNVKITYSGDLAALYELQCRK